MVMLAASKIKAVAVEPNLRAPRTTKAAPQLLSTCIFPQTPRTHRAWWKFKPQFRMSKRINVNPSNGSTKDAKAGEPGEFADAKPGCSLY
jgi:hypothetical protein